jgi:hypothetical protein
VHVLPLRLRLDQDVVSYLRTFADAVLQPHTASALELLGAVQVGRGGGAAGRGGEGVGWTWRTSRLASFGALQQPTANNQATCSIPEHYM